MRIVRKISGFAKPSKGNKDASMRAVGKIAEASIRLLLQALETSEPAKNRQEEARKAKARSLERFRA